MGKPAARALIDQAAHGGIILTGSLNVFIGGLPAARKGDLITCSQHPQSSIVEGSGSVFVNGIPLARKDDKTLCLPGSPPANTAASQSAAKPPINCIATAAYAANEEGKVVNGNAEVKAFFASAGLEDKNGDGNYDTAHAGVALLDLKIGNMDDKNANLKGEFRAEVLTADANAGMYMGNGVYGYQAGAEATGYQIGGSVAAKNPYTNDESRLNGDVAVGKAEAKVDAQILAGQDGRYGFVYEATAEAKAVGVDGDVELTTLFGILKIKATGGVSAGSVGGGIDGGAYVDTNDYSLNMLGAVDLNALIGVEGGVDIGISAKPIVDGFSYLKDLISPPAASFDGTILTGCSTVLIG